MLIEELRNRVQQLLAEIKPLAERSRDSALTDEESARFDELIANLNEARQDLQRAEQRSEQGASVLQMSEEMAQSRGSVANVRPRVGGEQPTQIDHFRGIGHRFTGSDAFKAYAGHPKGNSDSVSYGSVFHGDVREAVDAAQEMGPPDQRALVHGGSIANYIQPNRLPGIVSGDPFPLRIRDVLQNGRTDSPAIEYVVKNASTNNAAGVAESTATSGVGANSKPESAINLEVKSTTVKTIAHFIPVTRQMLQDAAQIESVIEAELLYGLAQKVDTDIVSGAGGSTLTGILNTSGIQVLNAGYWTANPLPADANTLDALRRAVRQIQIAGESNASFIAAHPNDVELWETLKDKNGNYLMRSAGPEAGGVSRLWNRPVVPSLAIAAGVPLVGDGRRAIVFDRMDGQIFITDSHSDWFTKNIFAILAESRLALAVTMPAAFASVNLAAAIPEPEGP